MGIITFNWRGAFFGILAGIAGRLVSGKDDVAGAGTAVAGLMALTADGCYRAFLHGRIALMAAGYDPHLTPAPSDPWRFVRPAAGGHVFFLPVWLIGLALLGLGAAELTGQAANNQLMEDLIRTTDELRVQLNGVDSATALDRDEERIGGLDQQLHRLHEQYRKLPDEERRRLERKFGERLSLVASLLERERERVSRLQ
jgi:hypothetical protein